MRALDTMPVTAIDLDDLPTANLCGGMRERALIGIALAGQPAVLIATN